MTTYRFVLTARNGDQIGELAGASDRAFTITLSGIPTASFTLPLSDPLARRLSNPDDEHLVKVYADTPGSSPSLVFHGPVIDVETTYGQGGAVRVNCAGPFWNLTHRYVGGKEDGSSEPTYEGIDRSYIARDLISIANDQGATGINPDGMTGSWAPVEATFTGVKFKNVAEWITELGRGQLGAATTDGFDWLVVPCEYDDGYIGTFRTGTPSGPIHPRLIGGTLSQFIVFEMGEGTRNNLIEARQPVTRDGLANVVYHQPQDSTGAVVRRDNTPSISARGRHEAVLTDDILDDTYRGQLADTHVAVRKQPRRILEITPAPEDPDGRVPRFLDDYNVGDQVGLRIVEWGEVVVNATVRIYQIAVSVDDTGTPTHTLTIVPTG